MKSIVPSLTSAALFLVLFCGCSNSPKETTPEAAPFAKGADVGWLTEMESAGVKFYDNNGLQKECIQLLKEKQHP
jgi:arabinogalactan endo-1,4-beta-galactosidase